ncbi:CheR family methyltransferase [Actinoplanes teichomyceticus]|uniref:protein-glutamate O-methyltransferase n=1 Tax=Actinoplanes teichomyceticus TaxID=1867 RepID=A0A561WMY8_ACTTI|nr:protein-glutamate O-methyltransferase CheR [Actinoplanes teichomyceticus]TWG25247.1 CheR-type MCP methyltransferase [Actinoplanes teichomyceticus]GIF10316.1 chemotaxis protein methyltransferase [Actinoplanes teichomyceticus]
MADATSTGAGLSDADFARFTEYFYKRTGIHFTAGKRYFVDKRVEACIRNSSHSTFASWFAALRTRDRSELLQELINQLTVNETYFLREDYQFDALLSTVLPQVLSARGGVRRITGALKILSLPCSTGEEPYSIALRLLEEWDQIDHVDVEIHGADIDSAVLAKAAHASYGERSLQRVPKAWLNKYFVPVGSGRHQVDDGIRSAVTLHRVNVCDTASMRAFRDYDVIFCRNVLIYFDELSSRRAAENLYGALRPGGYLFLGHSESMSRISPIFTPTRLPEGIVYQRPTGAN